MVPLLVHLPTETVETAYGTLWPEAEQGLPHYLRLAVEAGFEVSSRAWQGLPSSSSGAGGEPLYSAYNGLIATTGWLETAITKG
jgi:hypothetical protein